MLATPRQPLNTTDSMSTHSLALLLGQHACQQNFFEASAEHDHIVLSICQRWVSLAINSHIGGRLLWRVGCSFSSHNSNMKVLE